MVQYYVIQLLSVLGRSRTAEYPQYPTIQIHVDCNLCQITLTQQVHNFRQVPPMATAQSRALDHAPKGMFPDSLIISLYFYYLVSTASPND